MTAPQFRRLVWAHYKKHGRHELPWRKTHDPYRILVSEVMLQQTQVQRVQPYYREFLKQFPTARRLAEAPLSEVLKAWQGLGYNRRAKMLHAAAKEIAKHGMPKTALELEKLPGVGPYTARAVATFAYDADEILIETNIRTVVFHHFFSHNDKVGNTIIYDSVSDTQIAEVLRRCAPSAKSRSGDSGKGGSREWNYALMDYGAYLKSEGVKQNAKSKHYTKQKKFSGSLRQARGALVRELTKGSATRARLLGLLGDDRASQAREALSALQKEGVSARLGRALRALGLIFAVLYSERKRNTNECKESKRNKEHLERHK